MKRKYSDDEKAFILSARGMMPASIVAKQLGISRNAVCSMWNRNLPPMDPDRRSDMVSFSQKVRQFNIARAATCV